MGVMMLDYGRSFSREILLRLADIGCREILLFDLWHEHEPRPEVYEFDSLIDYARTCREAGLALRIQTPVGVPLWCPEDWFLQNDEGCRSNFSDALLRFPESPTGEISYERTITLGMRVLSYWHEEAQLHLKSYVTRVRQALECEGATCINSIGACGEYLFPAVQFYQFLGAACTPWWHDTGAVCSWQEFVSRDPNGDRSDWLFGQLSQITAQRIGWYREKWLQYVPYFQGWGNFGVDNASQVLEQNQEGLNTILFTAFHDNYIEKATMQAAKYPTWGGAEGAANVVLNSHRAHDIGMRGVVCGPLWFHYAHRMEDEVYDQIRTANEFWKSVES